MNPVISFEGVGPRGILQSATFVLCVLHASKQHHLDTNWIFDSGFESNKAITRMIPAPYSKADTFLSNPTCDQVVRTKDVQEWV